MLKIKKPALSIFGTQEIKNLETENHIRNIDREKLHIQIKYADICSSYFQNYKEFYE